MRPGRKRSTGLMKPTKSEWRRELLAARASIPTHVRTGYAQAITERARRLACFEGAAAVLGYEAIGAEVDPASLMAWASANGASTFIPGKRASDDPIWAGWPASVESGAKTWLTDALPIPIVVVVPGVGYDERGVRLGRGQGFYDRALAGIRAHGRTRVVALAFECQVVPELPVDPWDASVDFIVTESRVLECDARRGTGEGARLS
jgi:5-formyltetrahydrofolate cyclo-ligase